MSKIHLDNSTSEVENIENGVFQNAPFANAPFANCHFPNGGYSCLWALPVFEFLVVSEIDKYRLENHRFRIFSHVIVAAFLIH